MEEVRKELEEIAGVLYNRMTKSETKGKTITLKVKYSDFCIITRSRSVNFWINTQSEITELYESFIPDLEFRDGIRLLGLTISNLNHGEKKEPLKIFPGQLTLAF